MLGKEGMKQIAEAVHQMTSGDGRTLVRIAGAWRSDIRWGRNTVGIAEDQQDYTVIIHRTINGSAASRRTNQLSPSALQEAVHFVEAAARAGKPRIVRPSISLPMKPLDSPSMPIWSESTAGISIGERSRIAGGLVSKFSERNVLSSGFLEWRCYESRAFKFGGVDGELTGTVNDVSEQGQDNETKGQGAITDGPAEYVRHTQAQCSMTAFHPNSIDTVWAGSSSFDWNAVSCDVLATRLIDKCLAFTSPGVLEPGRYTAILEPQAVSTFTNLMVKALDRTTAERGGSTYTYSPDHQLNLWRTRLGMKIVDDRITIGHNPTDPMLGVLPIPGLGPVTWIEQGKLMSLAYNQTYAQQLLREAGANPARPAYCMEGGTTSVEEMIQSTKHGVMISRFSDLITVHANKMLITGQTQDGIWEIRGGRLARAVHNMRFTDSPLLAFNAVEAIGPSVPVFSPADASLMPVVVPTMKVDRFSLTASLSS